MNKPNKLIIHAGMPKTGSTSLQAFLFNNPALLSSWGYCYPKAPVSYQSSTGFEETRHLFINDAYLRGNLQSAIAHVFTQLSEPNVILSDELFYYLLFCEHNSYFNALQKHFERFEITIFLYLRRQDSWLESFYRHCVNVNIWAKFIGDRAGFIHLMEHTRNKLAYFKNIQQFKARFPNVNIIVRDFDVASLVNHTIVDDFITRGLKIDGFISTGQKRLHESLSVYEALAIENSRLLGYDAKTIRQLRHVLRDVPLKSEALKSVSLLPYKQLERILNLYYQDNKLLAEQFGFNEHSAFRNDIPTFTSDVKKTLSQK